MAVVRDFMYLDVQRLRSFASQLLRDGIPTGSARSETHSAEAGGELRGRLPFVLEGGANTKAVMAATSTITSEVHHRLIEQVAEGLRDEGLLLDAAETAEAPDGAFVLLRAQVQIIDPDSLAATIRKLPQVTRAIASMSGSAPPPERSRADRRAGRGNPQSTSDVVSKAQADAFGELVDFFAPGTVRLRLVHEGVAVATAVVERDKFVEDLDRLIRRHGYLTGADWETLAQVNASGDPDLYAPSGTTLMDVLEGSLLEPMRTITELSGTASTAGLAITPLAIYRVISPRAASASA